MTLFENIGDLRHASRAAHGSLYNGPGMVGVGGSGSGMPQQGTGPQSQESRPDRSSGITGIKRVWRASES